MRIGFGNDIHSLSGGRKLYVGGIEIPSPVGEVAHSDGDVLLHALIDAILGALSLDDIGTYFPDSDEKYKNADSKVLLKEILEKTKPKIINMDSVITLERPKLCPYIASIRESIASLCSISISQVSVKAKTNESMGPIGEGRAIKAEVIILLDN